LPGALPPGAVRTVVEFTRTQAPAGTSLTTGDTLLDLEALDLEAPYAAPCRAERVSSDPAVLLGVMAGWMLRPGGVFVPRRPRARQLAAVPEELSTRLLLH
jgi:hypothetical protein